jgi:ribosomal protein L11 methyltransferase
MLETVSVAVPEHALEAYEAALSACCGTIGLFLDEPRRLWVVEGVRDATGGDAGLAAALALAEAVSGVAAAPSRTQVAAEGWLARTASAFPEQLIGARLALRGTHLPAGRTANRVTLRIDAGVAFGSGEHGSTRGCLLALERLARRRRRWSVADIGTGSGVLAMAAARLLRPHPGAVLATDIDPWAVRTAQANARLNGLASRVRCLRADGWASPSLHRAAPFGLILANILARPLCLMARPMAAALAAGGTSVLSGLLASQVRMVASACRRAGLVLVRVHTDGNWATLTLRKPRPRRTGS